MIVAGDVLDLVAEVEADMVFSRFILIVVIIFL
jgi:hypothetical protein